MSNVFLVDLESLHTLLGKEELYQKALNCMDIVPTKERFTDLKEDLRAKANELADWWNAQADAEIEMVVAKSVEYGADDLKVMGHDLAHCMRREVTDEEAIELGIFSYVLGKMARWRSAVYEGRRVSDDSLLDIGVYIRMAQRCRQTGGWPGTPK